MKFDKLIYLAALLGTLVSCRTASKPIVFDPMSLGPSGATLKKYLDREEHPTPRPDSLVGVVKIEASLPNLNKKGEMVAEKTLAPNGTIDYEMRSFTGDNTIKKEVIGRYLSSEKEASATPSFGITAQNYRFKLKRRDRLKERNAVVFDLVPRKNAIGLFKGELWLDEDSGMPLRETGRLVKNPSVIFKTLDFTRDYDFKDGILYLAFQDSQADTRLIGKVLIRMEFDTPHYSSATLEKTHASLD
ncbi:sigma-E factor regulatory protein RseB domain-containing protein [Bryobacter aggregatus]|uniref:sigma-E factor regulatory protein RseB domain-containing protein n=1 Tax=Bryobacter aggregatus TaxID=360054 RepID=UPI0004E2416C|nr:sigma-E factor regulatory protein RseB domain-containing protein [Bryobacter aggregatus]